MRQILLVDGHTGVREALAKRLRYLYDVTAVESLERAAEALRDCSPEVLIVDPRTIAADIDDVLALRSRAARPLIVLTSSLQDGDAARLRGEGVSAILLKGVPFADLLAEIEAAVHLPNARPSRPLGGVLRSVS